MTYAKKKDYTTSNTLAKKKQGYGNLQEESFLLQENGSFLLLEDGCLIIIREVRNLYKKIKSVTSNLTGYNKKIGDLSAQSSPYKDKSPYSNTNPYSKK